MKTIFDIQVSHGSSVESATITSRKIDISNFNSPAVASVDENGNAIKDGEYYCASIMHSRRSKRNIDEIRLLVFDLDKHSSDEITLIRFALAEQGYEHIMHTTTSHTPENPRYRLILQPDNAMSVVEYKVVMVELAKQLSISKFDPVSLNSAGCMLYPLVIPGKEGEYKFFYEVGTTVNTKLLSDEILSQMNTAEDSILHQPMSIPANVAEPIWYSCILSSYPASDLDYDGWLKVGMAMYHQTQGEHPEYWVQWSSRNRSVHGQKITEHDMISKKWPSFKQSGGDVVSLRSILNTRNAAGESVLVRAYNKLLSLMSDEAVLDQVVADMRNDRFLNSNDHRLIAEQLAIAINKTGSNVVTVDQALCSLSQPSNEEGDVASRHYFFVNYLYEKSSGLYYHLKTDTFVTPQAMNYSYGSALSAMGIKSEVHRAITYEMNGYIKPRTMEGLTYLVNHPKVRELDEVGSRVVLNQFNPKTWPQSGEPFNPSHDIDSRIADMIEKHFMLLSGGEQITMDLLTQHLAHLRQKPNKRIHFGYAITSQLQGIGKSTLRKLYATVLGDEQINVLYAQDITDSFNAFTTAPKLMTFIEEFEFDSFRERNRAIKRMKDYITSDTVSVRKMYKHAASERTYTAYAIFSNDDNVLGSESYGRRWVPIIVETYDDTAAQNILGMPKQDFYREYYGYMDRYRDRFVAYFESVDVSTFDTEKAPVNRHKDTVKMNSPDECTRKLIDEIRISRATIDVRSDYLNLPSLFTLINESINQDDLEMYHVLRGISRSRLYDIVLRVIKTMGYRKLSADDKGKIDFGFEMRGRCSDATVWLRTRDLTGATTKQRRQYVKRRLRQENRKAKPSSSPDPFEF